MNKTYYVSIYYVDLDDRSHSTTLTIHQVKNPRHAKRKAKAEVTGSTSFYRYKKGYKVLNVIEAR